jgi:hypothetical protein
MHAKKAANDDDVVVWEQGLEEKSPSIINRISQPLAPAGPSS